MQADGGHPVCLAPCVGPRGALPSRAERRDASSKFLSVCVSLHLHAGDFTPRFQAPVGRRP